MAENDKAAEIATTENIPDEAPDTETPDTEETEPVSEDSVIPPVLEEEQEEQEEQINKKSFKAIWICIIAVAAALIIAAGVFIAIFFNQGKDTSEEIIETASVLMFVSDTEDTSFGNLYYKAEDGEKIQIGRDVQSGCFLLMPQTQVVYYLDKDETLYMCEPGSESEKLAENANFYSLAFSDDETIFTFTTCVDEKNILYRKELNGEKEKICPDMGYCTPFLSPDGKKIYYSDIKENFYVWDVETDEDEKLASNVSFFTADNNAYAYDIYNEEKESYRTYVKLANETESSKSDELMYVQWCQNGYAMLCLRDWYWSDDEQFAAGDLYLYYAGADEGTRIATDICDSFSITKDGRTVYYTDTDGNFYKKELPEITEKTVHKPERIEKQLEKSEKIKLASSVDTFEISPDGKNAVCLDDDSNMYVCVDGKEKAKVGTDVDTMYIFNESFTFLTNDGNFYVNTNYVKAKNIKDENSLVAEHVKSISASFYGQNIFYCLENDKISLLKNGEEEKEMINDTQEFDKIVHNDDTLFEKLLSMRDLAGNYYIESEECLVKISTDGDVEYYLTGAPLTTSVEISYPIDKYKSSIVFGEDDYYIFTVDEDNIKSLSNSDNDKYILKILSAEDFKSEIDKQKKAEEERIAEEKRQEELRKKREELEEKGKYYYYNGYYVSSSDTLYSYPNTSSATGRTYTTSSTKSVYGYSVSENGDKLWLKVRATDEYGSSSYYWVLAK